MVIRRSASALSRSVVFSVSRKTTRAPTANGNSRLAIWAREWNSGSTPRTASRSVTSTTANADSRSAARLPWVSTTPLGSEVVPEV